MPSIHTAHSSNILKKQIYIQCWGASCTVKAERQRERESEGVKKRNKVSQPPSSHGKIQSKIGAFVR